MRRAATLLLTLCLVVDMALPLMPGAFRFNADESIDGVYVRTARVAVASGDRLPLPSRLIALDDRTPAVQVLARRIEPSRRPRRTTRPVQDLPPESSPPASEDH